jgi:hypothetical protein
MSRLGHRSMRPVGRGGTPFDAVDAALAMASRSEMMTAAEAARLLRAVQAAVAGGAPEAKIVGIVSDATMAFSGQMVLERSRVVDPLLDIRLVLRA